MSGFVRYARGQTRCLCGRIDAGLMSSIPSPSPIAPRTRRIFIAAQCRSLRWQAGRHVVAAGCEREVPSRVDRRSRRTRGRRGIVYPGGKVTRPSTAQGAALVSCCLWAMLTAHCCFLAAGEGVVCRVSCIVAKATVFTLPCSAPSRFADRPMTALQIGGRNITGPPLGPHPSPPPSTLHHPPMPQCWHANSIAKLSAG